MNLRGRAHKVTRGDAGARKPATDAQASERLEPIAGGRLWSSGEDDYDYAREHTDGRELAACSAEHADADRVGWSRSHHFVPPAEL